MNTRQLGIRTLLALPAVLGWMLGACSPTVTNPSSSLPVDSVAITPAVDTVVLLATRQLGVTLHDSLGATITGRLVTWSSADSNIVRVNSSGLVTARAMGSTTITATSEGKSATATIFGAPVVNIDPRLPSLFAGDTITLGSHLTDNSGGAVAGLAAGWVSLNPAIATVSATGLVTAVSVGTATITATAGAGGGSADFVVLQPNIRANRRIAYLQDVATAFVPSILQLQSVNADGSVPVTITPDNFTVQEYEYSPDGSQIALVGGYDFGFGVSYSLYVVNANGTGLDSLRNDAAGWLRWSPDGLAILYTTTSHPGTLAVVRPDGTGYRQLAGMSGADLLYPEWSPDGRQVAFVRQTTSCEQLWVMDADGSHQQRLNVAASACRLQWSPDGRDILFTGTPSPSGMWLVHPDGTGFRPFTLTCAGCPPVPLYDVMRWSPDATQLAFRLNDAGDVGVTSRDGSVLLTILLHQPNSINGTIDPAPRWSPDGLELVYGTRDAIPAHDPAVGVMTATGTGQAIIVQGVLAQTPRWQP
ncbi:MAG: Ig-like domain-containing protein [Gemmatimonadales bacterium]